MFREVEAVCERYCLEKVGVSKVLCIRRCVSPSCYQDIYQADLVNEALLICLNYNSNYKLFCHNIHHRYLLFYSNQF